MGSRILFFLLFACFCLNGFAQKKQEREFRINKEDFPKEALNSLSSYLQGTKKIRYYQEQDGEKKSFEIKFKKDRLFYSIEFDLNGVLEDVEFVIKPEDVPDASWKTIQEYFSKNFEKSRVKKIQQQYQTNESNQVKVLKDAFQNLLLPYINYEIIITAKDKEGYSTYEVTFDSDGHHVLTRKSVRSKYDHVLFQ
ncbi:hypothetical protein [Croceivirga thetidis]|uniref:PepSY domain-containing protein n=1 Tax=Croceivirga thetidis TaxID=2721623 RepID=A0ABX1GNQ7_9FLAO|nr:hypothetical protein [Croceivirga thetidis]NKI31550.1 hypothetical protein [Croceivirga thetidis]